jgi:phospholipid-binding lipoprotein MlaA
MGLDTIRRANRRDAMRFAWTSLRLTAAVLVLLCAAVASAETAPDAVSEDYDPWEPFNERMFNFNYKLDRYVLKPVAKGWDKVMPDEVQRMISSAFDNVGAIKRMVNSALQGKWGGAGREVARFLINTTIGFGGLWDMAHKEWGIEKSNEDFGQTLGTWGVGNGAYLVLPLLDPMTVRDGIGRGVDAAMDPLSYFLPLLPVRAAMRAGDTVNDRALNYELFQGVEETTVDLYSSVRHYYLERRKAQIAE